MEGGEQHVAAAVAGEDAAGAVRAVGGGRQAHDHQPGARVAEPGHRAAPVLLVQERAPLHAGHLLAPRHQAGAGAAADDLGVQVAERAHGARWSRRNATVSAITAGSCWRLLWLPPSAMRRRIGGGVMPASAKVAPPGHRLVAGRVPVAAGHPVVAGHGGRERQGARPVGADPVGQLLRAGGADGHHGAHPGVAGGGVQREHGAHRRPADAERRVAGCDQAVEACGHVVQHPGVQRPAGLAMAAQVDRRRGHPGRPDGLPEVAVVLLAAAVSGDDQHPWRARRGGPSEGGGGGGHPGRLAQGDLVPSARQ